MHVLSCLMVYTTILPKLINISGLDNYQVVMLHHVTTVTWDIHARVDTQDKGVFRSQKSVTDVSLTENGEEGDIVFYAYEVLAIRSRRYVLWNHYPACFSGRVDSEVAVLARWYIYR